jgi:hypothetical protein
MAWTTTYHAPLLKRDRWDAGFILWPHEDKTTV